MFSAWASSARMAAAWASFCCASGSLRGNLLKSKALVFGKGNADSEHEKSACKLPALQQSLCPLVTWRKAAADIHGETSLKLYKTTVPSSGSHGFAKHKQLCRFLAPVDDTVTAVHKTQSHKVFVIGTAVINTHKQLCTRSCSNTHTHT